MFLRLTSASGEAFGRAPGREDLAKILVQTTGRLLSSPAEQAVLPCQDQLTYYLLRIPETDRKADYG